MPEPPPAMESSGRVELAEDVILTQEQMDVLAKYMDRYYQSLAGLKIVDPSTLFVDEAGEQALGNRTVWEYLIGVRRMQRADLSLSTYRYRLVCREVIEQEDGTLLVMASEDSVQHFTAYPDVDAECVVIYHGFVLEETENGWRLYSHMQMDSLYFTLFGGGENAASQDIYARPWFAVDDAQEYFPVRLAELLAAAEQNTARRGTEAEVLRQEKPDHGYDRRAAVAYAKEWVGYRNPDWPDYGWYGGNCQNYVSQCLLEGGIPMDADGPDVWKWYDDVPDNMEGEMGRSSSWSGVTQFRDYIAANTGYGVTGRVNVPYYSGQVGDVLVLGETEDWKHSVVITDVLTDAQGNTVDYLVSSNTADVRSFPASAYYYTHQSLTTIDGWNSPEEVEQTS